MDVILKQCFIVSQVLHSEIIGAVKMKSMLSGMPELKLGLNDKLLFEATGKTGRQGKAVEMEDIRFHQVHALF
jgi:AP-1 complex subunit mu